MVKKIIMFAILLSSILIIFLVYNNFCLNFKGYGDDFKVYFNAAKSLKIKKNLYEKHLLYPNLDKSRTVEYIYPPLLAFVLSPITFLPLKSAKILWNFLSFMFLGSSLYLTFLVINKKPSLFDLGIIILMLLFSQPVFAHFYYIQVNFLIFFLILLCFYFYQKNNLVFSSFFLSLGVLIKINPAIFLFYFLVKKEIKFIFYFFTFSFLLIIFNVVFNFSYYLKLYVTYFIKVLPSLSFPTPAPENQSLGGFIGRLFIPNQYLTSLFSLPQFGLMIYKFLLLLFIVLFLIVLTNKKVLADLKFCISFIFIFSLIISPVVWIHYYIFLIFPLIYFLYCLPKSKLDKIILTSVILLIWFIYDRKSLFFSAGFKVLFISSSFYGLLGLLFLLTKNKFKEINE